MLRRNFIKRVCGIGAVLLAPFSGKVAKGTTQFNFKYVTVFQQTRPNKNNDVFIIKTEFENWGSPLEAFHMCFREQWLKLSECYYHNTPNLYKPNYKCINCIAHNGQPSRAWIDLKMASSWFVK